MDEMYHRVLLSLLLVGLSRSGTLPVLNLFTAENQQFRLAGRLVAPTHVKRGKVTQTRGTWVRLAVQNIASIGAQGWERGPKS